MNSWELALIKHTITLDENYKAQQTHPKFTLKQLKFQNEVPHFGKIFDQIMGTYE